MGDGRDLLDDTAAHDPEPDASAEDERDSFRLVVHVDDRFETVRLPSSGEVTIGRGSACAVRIDHASISRAHAVLTIGRALRIRDVGSGNGTRVAGHRIQPGESVEISVGDAIMLGAAMVVVQRFAAARPPHRVLSHDYFEVRMEEECARRARTGGEFSVVRVNVTSPAASEVVQDALARALRAHDVLAIYAPHEYEIFLDTGVDGARDVTARLVAALDGAGIGANTGIATYPADGAAAGALIASANDAVRGRKTPTPIPESGAMEGLRELVECVAASTISVLILGETGVGKEVLAQTVHRLSPRAEKVFLCLNCAALSETLLESELFGHERGAFTGAVTQKRGLLETADGGTVFLDEIGELPLATQVKLLRVIEERKVTRVGGLSPRVLDVRFVAATNRDLEAEVARGAFRQDLFFRLNGVTVVVPPLRERVREIEKLAHAFIEEASRERGRTPTLTREALAMLEAYSWPGNIRELRNVVERAVLLCGDGDITPRALPVGKMTAPISRASAPATPERASARPHAEPGPTLPPAELKTDTYPSLGALGPAGLRGELEALERQRILDALERCVWNQTKAAQLLGVSRGVLIARLDQYGIARPRKPRGE
jgi:two-component system response regulator AtoC